MPGMLGYGAMAGVGKEFLKQSDERRANEYQAIRDRRLAGLQKDVATHGAGLTTAENIRQEGVAAEASGREAEALKTHQDAERKNRLDVAAAGEGQVVPAGSALVKGGEMIHDQPKTFAPSSASSSQLQFDKESVKLRGSQTQRKSSELYNEWYKQAYVEIDNPEFPGMGIKMKIRSKDIADWPTWHNQMVVDEDRMAPDDPKYMQGDPDALWGWANQNRKNEMNDPDKRNQYLDQLKRDNPWWGGPAEMLQAPPVPAAAPSGEAPQAEPAPPAPPTLQPRPSNVAGVVMPGAQGMLSQGQQPMQVTSPDAFSGPVNRRIAELERELAALEGRSGRTIAARRQAITRELENQRRMLGGQ